MYHNLCWLKGLADQYITFLERSGSVTTKLVRLLPLAIALLAGCLFAAASGGQTGTLAEPFAPPSPNAALQYQRALLYLSAIGDDESALLHEPTTSTAGYLKQ